MSSIVIGEISAGVTMISAYSLSQMALFRILSFLALVALVGCAPQPNNHATDDAYGLLYSVTSQQQNVDKLLWIKDPGPDITAWVEQIAKFNTEVTQQLDAWKKSGHIQSLKILGLPKAELEARERATKRTTGELLFSEDVSLRLSLVIAQLKALGYCSDLCYAIQQETTNADITAKAKDWEQRFKQLNADGMKLLETPAVTTPETKSAPKTMSPPHK